MLNKLSSYIFIFLLFFVLISSCKKEKEIIEDKPDCTNCNGNNQHEPTPYNLERPTGFPPLNIPSDNPMTVEGVDLGKKLFYDPILSLDNSISCASCHNPDFNFTDNGKAFSVGVGGQIGNRTSMPLVNLVFNTSFFWDGKVLSLEEFIFHPVRDPIEMALPWEQAEQKLQNHSEYPELFKKAFGTNQIDSTKTVKAIAQFVRTLISANSKFDKFARFEGSLSPQELNGFNLFNSEDGDCFHCHIPAGRMFTDNLFHNNGLDSIFTDLGRALVTGNAFDEGKFKTPNLRNLSYSAPFMHDGRFQTIEEVIEHYDFAGHPSPTISPLMEFHGIGLNLNQQEKNDLIAFLKSLDDPEFINNPKFRP